MIKKAGRAKISHSNTGLICISCFAISFINLRHLITVNTHYYADVPFNSEYLNICIYCII